jgi:hypothetical protein
MNSINICSINKYLFYIWIITQNNIMLMKKKLHLLILTLFLTGMHVSSQVLMNENFNSSIPPGWNAGTYSQTTTDACDIGSIRHNLYSFSATTNTSSYAQVATGNDIVVSLDYKVIDWSGGAATMGNFGTMNLQYTIDGGTSWINYDVIDNSNHVVSTQCATRTFTIPAASVPTGSSFAWKLNGTWSAGDYYFYIDNFSAVEQVTCMPPSALNVTNVTATTLDFGWTENNGSGQWDFEYGAIGFALGTGNQSFISANPYSVAITQGSEYDFYVRSVCSIGDTSGWSGPYQFKYCDVSSQYTFDYLTGINSTGALVNVNYTASANPAGGYANETAQNFESFESQSFDVNTTYTSAYNGVNVWVDWNKNMVFEASELMASAAGTVASQTLAVIVPGGTAQGDYRMRVRGDYGNTANPPACGSSTYGSTVDFNLTIIAPPSCLPVNSLTVNNVTDNSLGLGWTSSGTATTWNIEYGPTGFTPGTGTTIPGVTTNPYSITGLSSNTQYDFYVQADCGGGDLSYWSSAFGPILTECSSYLANGLCEGFDINLSPTIACWRVRDANNDGDAWGVSTNLPNTGAYSAVFYSDYNAGANDDYLISPQLIMTGIEAMKFAYRVQSANEPNDFQVLLSTTGTNIADFTDTIMHLAQYTNIVYEDTVIDLTSYTGSVYIAFHIPPGGVDGWNLFIDDVCFGECIPTPGQDGSVDVCVLENSVDLSDNIVSHNNSYGRWEFPANQALIVDDTMFNVGMMAEGSHEVMYIVEGLCQEDTTIATINVYKASSAGIDGVMEVCKNTPSNLFSALTGNIDFGGTWYDPANVALPNSQPNAPSIPGMYQYTYVTDNGHCTADTSIVTITVDGGCDNLSLGNDILTDVSVYPNPATSILTIVNPSNATSLKVEILDMNGRIVLVEDKALNNASEATLTIDYLEKGIYTLRIFNTEGQKTFKIVKQ